MVIWYAFGFGDRQTAMFRALLVLYILPKGLLVLGSTRSLLFRIDIHSLAPFPKQSQLPERIMDMGRNEKHTSRWSHFSVIFGQLLPCKLHGKV
jgi:hypothetical protein